MSQTVENPRSSPQTTVSSHVLGQTRKTTRRTTIGDDRRNWPTVDDWFTIVIIIFIFTTIFFTTAVYTMLITKKHNVQSVNFLHIVTTLLDIIENDEFYDVTWNTSKTDKWHKNQYLLTIHNNNNNKNDNVINDMIRRVLEKTFSLEVYNIIVFGYSFPGQKTNG